MPLPTPPLSDTQRQTLAAVLALRIAHGYTPSLQELAEELGVVLSAARTRLLRLQARGCVTWDAGKNRTLRLTEKGMRIANGELP